MQTNDFNKIIITGYASTTPVLSNTANGTPVLNFELQSFMKKRSDVFNVTVWGDLARKGSYFISPKEKLLIEGHIQHKKTGELGLSEIVEVVAKRIYSIGNDASLGEFNSITEF